MRLFSTFGDYQTPRRRASFGFLEILLETAAVLLAGFNRHFKCARLFAF
jgi:hypothetical protein